MVKLNQINDTLIISCENKKDNILEMRELVEKRLKDGNHKGFVYLDVSNKNPDFHYMSVYFDGDFFDVKTTKMIKE